MTGLNENDEYKLKKDLPNIKAGETFIVKSDEHGFLYLVIVNKISLALMEINNFDEWFKKVEKKWKPNIGQYYWYITETGNLRQSVRKENEGGEMYGVFFDLQFELGNVFETKADAMFCRDEFIKKAFKEYHKNYQPGNPRG